MQNIYEVQAANKRKSNLVVIGFFIFTILAVYVLGRAFGYYLGFQTSALGMVGIALILSGFMTFFSYYYSDRIVLTISGAKPADRENYFDFYTVTQNLALASGITMPRLYVINDSAPNAFATGRNPDNAVICATTGLLDKLDRTELEGVIAHEMTHVLNYDVRLMSLVSVMVGLIALLGDWFLRMQWIGSGRRRGEDEGGAAAVIFLIIGLFFAIMAPVIANLIKLAISRRREFMADAGSVKLTRQPSGLINALLKISSDEEPLEAANKATAHMYIVNPFKEGIGNKSVARFSNLFNTHPPIQDRIAALEKME
jgi:heat shock protein HtpX